MILEADCLDAMRDMDEASVDSIVTDPPAGISFMGKHWDSDRSGGFVEWLASVMREALRVAKPGAHAVVWALPRTCHWTGSAIEGAGWEVRDVITHHFGSGFPKSHNVGNGFGTALKPATEFYFLARKPLIGTVAQNVLEHGTGALNVDGCRIATTDRLVEDMSRKNLGGAGGAWSSDEVSSTLHKREGVWENTAGRWPANVALSHLCIPVLRLRYIVTNDEYQFIRGVLAASGIDLPAMRAEVHTPVIETETGSGEVLLPQMQGRAPTDGKGRVASETREAAHGKREGEDGADEAPACDGESSTGREASRLEGRKVSERGLLECAGPRSEPGGSTASEVDDTGQRVHLGTSTDDGPEAGPTADTAGKRPPHQRQPDGQSTGESDGDGTGEALTDASGDCARARDAAAGERRIEIPASAVPAFLLSYFEPGHTIECERVGTRRVKDSSHPQQPTDTGDTAAFGGGIKDGTAYGDENGTEQVEAWRCAAGCPVAELDRQSGELHSQDSRTRQNRKGMPSWSPSGTERSRREIKPEQMYGDTGGASRFFYVAKSSRAERNAGLDGFEGKQRTEREFGGADDTFAQGRNPKTGERTGNIIRPAANHHPTVKPIDLMRWLVRLVTPPNGTILDPFCGSGTTGIAATLEGFSFIGIEREAEYCAIARSRIAWWERHPEGMEMVERLNAEAERKAVADSGQLSFGEASGGE